MTGPYFFGHGGGAIVMAPMTYGVSSFDAAVDR